MLFMRHIYVILFSFLLNPMIFCQVSDNNWPVFRGNSDLSGNTNHEFTTDPAFLWSLPTDVMTK